MCCQWDSDWHNSLFGRASTLWLGDCRFDPQPSCTKDFKMVLIALSHGAQYLDGRANRSAQCQYNVTGWDIMSCVWGMIFQWGSTLKVSIELPATPRALRSLPHSDTVAIYLKDCWKWHKNPNGTKKPWDCEESANSWNELRHSKTCLRA